MPDQHSPQEREIERWPDEVRFGRCEQWGVEHISDQDAADDYAREPDAEYEDYVPKRALQDREAELEKIEDRFDNCDNCKRLVPEDDLKSVWTSEGGEQVDARICAVCRVEVERDNALLFLDAGRELQAELLLRANRAEAALREAKAEFERRAEGHFASRKPKLGCCYENAAAFLDTSIEDREPEEQQQAERICDEVEPIVAAAERATAQPTRTVKSSSTQPVPEPPSSDQEGEGWTHELVERIKALPAEEIAELAEGPLPKADACAVCSVLRWPGYSSGEYGPDCEEFEDANWLLNWHGVDPLRCGAIYGIALALATPTQPAVPVSSGASGDWPAFTIARDPVCDGAGFCLVEGEAEHKTLVEDGWETRRYLPAPETTDQKGGE